MIILLQQKNFGPHVIYIVLESCKLDTGGLYPARPRANKTRVGTEGQSIYKYSRTGNLSFESTFG